MQVWVVLHIAAMFAAVAAAWAGNWLIAIGVRRRDLEMLKAYIRVSSSFEVVSIGGLVIGIVFGLVAAVSGGFDLTSGWLLAAYALVAAGFVVGVATDGYFKRLAAAVRSAEEDPIRPELDALLRSPIPLAQAVWSTALIVVIIADMVLKPF
jgi:hypothetical protein